MNRFSNSKQQNFLASRNFASLEDIADKLTERCKFNFHYFTVQEAGQNFCDWTHIELVDLFGHIKNYCNFPLSHWERQPVGKSGSVLKIYGTFPKNSQFGHPPHVPHQALWGRFRLSHAKRLVGFVVPKELDGKAHPETGLRFCANTFYVVFLDAHHRFWSTEAK